MVKLNAEKSTNIHYEQTMENLTTKMSELQSQLSEYNAIMDKMSSVGYIRDEPGDDSTEISDFTDQEDLNMIRMFQKRQQVESMLNKVNQEINEKRKFAKKLIESMDGEIRKKFKLVEKLALTPVRFCFTLIFLLFQVFQCFKSR